MSLKSPRPRLPKMNALRAFEAAARHERFTGAAEELGVTPGAIAQQVKSLEAWFGQDLFHRHKRGVSLTDPARIALPELIAAFDAFGGAVRSMNNLMHSQKISIAALPAIAQLWLTPRMPKFSAAFPEMQVSISALEEAPNLNRELFDIALFFEEGSGEGIPLGQDKLMPVCNPSLLEGAEPVTSPADLARLPLLHDAVWKGDWARWLQVAKVRGVDPNQGPAYSLYSMALQAAIDGAGVLIGHSLLIEDMLADGRLVTPFEGLALSGHYLTLQLPPGDRRDGHLEQVINWFRAEASSI